MIFNKHSTSKGTFLLCNRYYKDNIPRLQVCPALGFLQWRHFFIFNLLKSYANAKTQSYSLMRSAPSWAHSRITNEESYTPILLPNSSDRTDENLTWSQARMVPVLGFLLLPAVQSKSQGWHRAHLCYNQTHLVLLVSSIPAKLITYCSDSAAVSLARDGIGTYFKNDKPELFQF